MPVWIHKIETAVPETRYRQSDIGQQMVEWTRDERDKRLVRMLYKGSGIEYRHSVIPDLGASFVAADGNGVLRQQTTAQRNAIYTTEASKLAQQLGRKLLASAADFAPAHITHVITASCTGFFNPGIDYLLCRDLELPPATRRYHLGFMGCYAAFPALSMAAQFCMANPDATVLVMCLELCTLHLQVNGTEDSILANSLFSDGAAALLVSARPPQPGAAAFKICDFESALIPSGIDAMAWSLGDLGFDISLSSYVPKIIGAGISDVLQPLLLRNALATADITRWAIHPGGKSIIDKVASGLDLAAEQLQPSRDVLRNFGNMSCATILFVLKEMMAQPPADRGEKICAVAFGPGLTVEMGLLELQNFPA